MGSYKSFRKFCQDSILICFTLYFSEAFFFFSANRTSKVVQVWEVRETHSLPCLRDGSACQTHCDWAGLASVWLMPVALAHWTWVPTVIQLNPCHRVTYYSFKLPVCYRLLLSLLSLSSPLSQNLLLSSHICCFFLWRNYWRMFKQQFVKYMSKIHIITASTTSDF